MTDLLDDIVPAAANAPAIRTVVVVVPITPEDEVTLADLSHDLGMTAEAALLYLLREVRRTGANSNGYAKAFKHVCSGCGREFDSNRRQLPGKRVWCGRAECKKEASALRARDYRDRKAKEPA